MTSKSLNELSDMLLKNHELTDEMLEFFREIDVMNSVGMMSWLTSNCRDAIKILESDTITYNGESLNKEKFIAILNDNLSELLMDRITEK